MKILLFLFFLVYLAFIWVLCRACTLAEEEEGFDE